MTLRFTIYYLIQPHSTLYSLSESQIRYWAKKKGCEWGSKSITRCIK